MYGGVILQNDALSWASATVQGVSMPPPIVNRPPGPLFFGPEGRSRLVLDSVIAVAGVLVTFADLRFTRAAGQLGVFSLVTFAYLAIPARQHRPRLVLAAATVVIALVAARGASSVALSLMLGLATYSVASNVPRPQSIRAVITSAAAIGTAIVFAEVTYVHSGIAANSIVDLLPLTAAWFVGDSVATRRRYAAGLAAQAEQERRAEIERARQAVREERVRIARELHDVIAHSLAVITVQAGVGRRLMAKRPEEAASALESIEATGRTAQDELRVVLGLLRDEVPAAAALEPAPGLSDLDRLAETVRAAGIPVELSVSGVEQPLSPALELSIYRITQEALTNVVKHAPGARATVELAVRESEVSIHVTDNGSVKPSKPAAAAASMASNVAASAAASAAASVSGPRPAHSSAQHGIVGMRERVGAFGGSLVAEPLAAGRGFRVLARIPRQGGA
jgi:signal transduction histidine kinase